MTLISIVDTIFYPCSDIQLDPIYSLLLPIESPLPVDPVVEQNRKVLETTLYAQHRMKLCEGQQRRDFMAMNVPFALESEHVRAVNYSPSASLLQHSLVLLCHFIDFSYKQILDFNSIQSSSFVRLLFPFSSCPTNNSKRPKSEQP